MILASRTPDSAFSLFMNTDPHYRSALASLEQTLDQLKGCSAQEKEALRQELRDLEKMQEKLTGGRVEIAVFGEISTGKSALINALVGEKVAAVNVQGGWTKELGRVDWRSAGYVVPGLEGSKVVLVDTPGLNEVGGGDRAIMSTEAARSADLILFVSDSDINEIEYSALLALAAVNKPIIFVLNKLDLYSREEQQRLVEILRDERLGDIIEKSSFVTTKADPREVERIIELTGPDHVGLGTDFFGFRDAPRDLQHIGQLPALTEALINAGHDDETIFKVLGGNYLRIFEQVWGE